MTRSNIAPALASLLLLVSGCHIFTNQDSSVVTPPVVLPPTTEHGVLIALSGFEPYLGYQADMRIVGGDGVVVTHVRIAQLTEPSYRLELGSIPRKPDSRVDVIIDANGDGEYTPGVDWTWQEPISAQNVAAIRADQRSTDIVEPTSELGDFELRLSGFGALEGSLIRVALQNFVHQITGLYTGEVDGDELVIRLPRIVVDMQPYNIALYVDANDNGRYDTPPLDAAWHLSTRGEPDGISFDFAYSTDFEDIDFEPR